MDDICNIHDVCPTHVHAHRCCVSSVCKTRVCMSRTYVHVKTVGIEHMQALSLTSKGRNVVENVEDTHVDVENRT